MPLPCDSPFSVSGDSSEGDSGSSDDGIYYTTQTVAVTDANLETVTLNGQEQSTASFALAGNVEESYTIAAVDMAGNETEYTVTMKPIEALEDGIAGVTAGTVTSADKAAIEQVKGDVAAVDTATATDGEKAALQDILDRCASLLAKIEESAQAGNTESTGKVENVTADNVTPEDKEDLTAAKEDLEKALNDFGGNYTEEEKAALEERLERIDKALESLDKAETVQGALSGLPDTVEPDETDKEARIEEARKQYEALTGDRGMGQLLDGQTRNYLPDDWQAVTKLLDSPSGYDSLSNSMQGYLNENKVLSDSEAEKLEPNSKAILEKQRQLYALNRALSEQVYNEASKRVALLQQLTDKIGSATDPKAILDLQARIQSEQTQLQNEAAKIQALSQQIVNEERGLKMQMREHIIKSGGDPKNVSNVFDDLNI